jgi:predicted RNA-binding Zn-ribbon protein involved in translation (DUF1610 family)
MYTYNISKRLCEILNTEFDPTQLPSDQELSTIPDDSEFIRKPLVVTGWKHTEETKQILSAQKLGKTAHNKGKPNPKQSERMRLNNPMHNLLYKQKSSLSRKGLPAHNKITKTFEFQCQQCGSKEIRRDTAHNKQRFCSKSCAATHSNLNRNRHSSQTPETQAS